MKYFSGFCFSSEEELFKDILYQSEFNVAGFSYGAIKAFEHVLTCKSRVDTLQLISPAFFQNKNKKYKDLQMRLFEKDSVTYSQNFLKNVALPSSFCLQEFFKEGSITELQDLLFYTWEEKKLQKLKEKGTLIEVYLGENDKIIEAISAADFFQAYATIYIKKEAGHILQE